MDNYFARQGAAYINELNRSLGALIGIAQGVLSDGVLNNDEIRFLNDWLRNNDAISTTWPGDVIYTRIKSVLADGSITEEERVHLIDILQKLIGGGLDELASNTHVTELAFDENVDIKYSGSIFCLTGEFVFAPRNICVKTIEERGGIVKKSVTKKLSYLVVGGLGSTEWKHGSFGTKIDKAIKYKREGISIHIIHEDVWAANL